MMSAFLTITERIQNCLLSAHAEIILGNNLQQHINDADELIRNVSSMIRASIIDDAYYEIYLLNLLVSVIKIRAFAVSELKGLS